MVGSGIKTLRESRNFTQEDLASKLGVSRQAICMWEAGKREPKTTMLKKIAKIFDVTIDEIVQSMSISPNRGKGIGEMRERIEITTNFELAAPKAKKVLLTGDFNSWDKNGIPLKKERNGTWKANLKLKPGNYQYKYIVDGQWWNDPSNTKTVSNSYGSLNSIKEVLV